MTLFIRFTVLSSLIFFISACSTLPSSNKQAANITDANELSSWSARGKILMVFGKEKESAYFYWRQSGDDFLFVLSTFLGVDVLSLKHDNGKSTLEVDGETHVGQNPQQLVATLINKNIPFEHLPTWLLGESGASNIVGANFDGNDQLKSFMYIEDDGFNPQNWQVNYANRISVQQLNLPKLLTIKSSDARIKLSISNWQLQG